MKHWLLLIAYDGFAYHGWQVQPNANTIEAEIEKALHRLTQTPTKVMGAGRTDAGVHALDYTAHFSSETDLPPIKWRQALNSLLPNDIVIKDVREVPEGFHARHSAIAKQYRYILHRSPTPNPFAPHHSWWIRGKLDFKSMRYAASCLLGEHDFSAFRASNCGSPNTIKNLQHISIREEITPWGNVILDFQANSFLKNMVRVLVGTLVEVGQERINAKDIPHILQSKDRTQAGQTAPAAGLYVLGVVYE